MALCFVSYKGTTHERHRAANRRDAVNHQSVGRQHRKEEQRRPRDADAENARRNLAYRIGGVGNRSATRTATSAPPASPVVTEMRARTAAPAALAFFSFWCISDWLSGATSIAVGSGAVLAISMLPQASEFPSHKAAAVRWESITSACCERRLPRSK